MKMNGLLAITLLSLTSFSSQADDMGVTTDSDLVVVMDCIDISGERTEEAMAKALRIIGKTDFDTKTELTMKKDGQIIGVYLAKGSLNETPIILKFGEKEEYILTIEDGLANFIAPAVLNGPQGQTNMICGAQ